MQLGCGLAQMLAQCSTGVLTFYRARTLHMRGRYATCQIKHYSMTKKARTIIFCLSSFASPIIIYLANVFLSDNGIINYYRSNNIDVFLISVIGVSIILESINVFIIKRKIATKYIITGLAAFLISVSLVIAFYVSIGNVYEDLFEAMSQYDNKLFP